MSSTDIEPRRPAGHPPTLEIASDLDTEVVRIVDLEAGQYVLLPEDAEDPDINLEVDLEYEAPLLVRVREWSGPDATEVSFDNPAGEIVFEMCPGEEETIRLVVPDQEHERWSVHAGD
jgi:hypothetical protein